MLNTFGTIRELQYFNNTQGSGSEGTVYGSKSVGMTGSALLNYIENAIFDTNQMRYYSAEKGMSDALYEQRRDLSNLIQKLEDQGYEIPSSVNEINSAAKKTASTNSKGQAMINNAVSQRTSYTASISSKEGVSIGETVKNALIAGGYVGIDSVGAYPPRNAAYAPRNVAYPSRLSQEAKATDKVVEFGSGTYVDKDGNTVEVNDIYKGTWGKETMKSDDGKVYRQFITQDGKEYFLNQEDANVIAWHESPTFEDELLKYKQEYEEWKALPADNRPSTWYQLYEYDSGYSPDVYNQMVSTNFNSEKLKRWFTINPKRIAWKQNGVKY